MLAVTGGRDVWGDLMTMIEDLSVFIERSHMLNHDESSFAATCKRSMILDGSFSNIYAEVSYANKLTSADFTDSATSLM